MDRDRLSNIRIQNEKIMITPEQLRNKLPLPEETLAFVSKTRQEIERIIHKKDHRLLVVCGPCSIHDPIAAIEYATELKKLSDELGDQLYLVMRVYFEKPRTTVGWKGLINDPYIDGSFDVEAGLYQSRKLLVDIANMGLPLATEALDPISPQYIGDLFSWAAIGARTTESQTHREMASGLSMPIGFKNGTDGNLSTAINAMKASALSHRFMGINSKGQVALLTTQGNGDGHVILRGGNKKTNYDAASVKECEVQMQQAGLDSTLMVDCSHANANKDYRNQSAVADDVFQQIIDGNQSIIGLMLESNLNEGQQSVVLPLENMAYGVSITDPCINWHDTKTLLRRGYDQLSPVLMTRLTGK